MLDCGSNGPAIIERFQSHFQFIAGAELETFQDQGIPAGERPLGLLFGLHDQHVPRDVIHLIHHVRGVLLGERDFANDLNLDRQPGQSVIVRDVKIHRRFGLGQDQAA